MPDHPTDRRSMPDPPSHRTGRGRKRPEISPVNRRLDEWSALAGRRRTAFRGPGAGKAFQRPPQALLLDPILALVLTFTISRIIRSRSPFPRQEGTRGRWGPIHPPQRQRRCRGGRVGKRSRRPGGHRGVSPRLRYAGDAPGGTGGWPPGYGMRGTPPRPPGGLRGVSPRLRYAGGAPGAPAVVARRL